MKKALFLLPLFLSFSFCQAQTSFTCGFDMVHSGMYQNDATYRSYIDNMRTFIKSYLDGKEIEVNPAPFTIPVVVHVVHPGDPYGAGYNISFEQIQWQIAALNAAFARNYPNYNMQQHGQYYTASTQIKFCLAVNSPPNNVAWAVNPNTNQIECGVRRYSVAANDPALEFDINLVSDYNQLTTITNTPADFPYNMYLNIWVLPDLCQGNACDGVISPPPPSIVGVGFMGVVNGVDGILMRTDCFGDNTVMGPNYFNLFQFLEQGKVMAHEAGHYLSLWHTFFDVVNMTDQSGCYGTSGFNTPPNPCNTEGDECCDTPPSTLNTVTLFPGCATPNNTCNETYFTPPPTDHDDMQENYMAYSDDDCYNTFTGDQTVRMWAMLNGPRSNVVSTANLTATGVLNLSTLNCACCVLVANILFSPVLVCPNQAINFLTPSGPGFCATTWTWSFPGGNANSTSIPNPIVTYATAGTYTVTLTASDGSSTVTQTATVTVATPSVQITGQSSTQPVCDGSSQFITVQFSNGTPPYNITICDNNNVQVVQLTNITQNPINISIPVVTANSNTFTICIFSDANCTGTATGTAPFNVIPCCPNMFINGDFESNGTGCNGILPSTTQQLPFNPNCDFYNPPYYTIYNPSNSSIGTWCQTNAINFASTTCMVLDGWGFNNPNCPIYTNNPLNQTEIWCQNITLTPGNYVMQFQCSGNFFSVCSGGPASPNQSLVSLLLQIKVNNTLIGVPIYIPPYSSTSPFVTYTVNFANVLPPGNYNVCICQVGQPNIVNFGVGAFDYMLDNITIRSTNALIPNAGLDQTICLGDQVQIGSAPFPNVNYSWSPTTNLSNSTISNPIASPTTTTTYTLNASDQSGCSGTDFVVITVTPSCCQGVFDAPATLGNVSIGPPIVPTMSVNQNLTINAGIVTFDNLNVRIATGIKIIVLPGCTLRIINQSFLHACSQMWDGIEVQPGGLLLVNTDSRIEDAKAAVQSISGGEFRLNTSIFNKNRIDIDVKAFVGTHPGVIRNSIFTCRTLPANPTVAFLPSNVLTGLPGAVLLTPYAGQRSNEGVHILDVSGSIVIGIPLVTDRNIFDNHNFGVWAVQSNVTIINNRFQNFQGAFITPNFPNPATFTGIAVVGQALNFSASNPATWYSMTIGGTGPQINSFEDCYQGINITNYVVHNIRGNNFNSNATRLFPTFLTQLNGDHGILIRSRYATQLDIGNNFLWGQATGIHIIRIPSGLLYPNNINVLNNSLFAPTSNTIFMNTGILVEDMITGIAFSGNAIYSIRGNSIIRGRTCIHARNIGGDLVIDANPVIYVRPNPFIINPGNRSGILVENCRSAQVINNVNIHSTGTNINAINNRRIRGVYIINSIGTTVACNYAYNIGQCFTFEGPQCNASRWELNRMFSACDGFVVRNNGIIGAQGSLINPVECLWLGGFTFSQTFVENTNNINSTSPLYVNVGPQTNPTINVSAPNPAAFYIPNVTNIVTNKTCPFPQGGPPPNFADNGNRNALVQDNIPFTINVPESRYTGKQSVLSDLFQDNSLMQNNNLLQQFFNSSSGNNFGKIHQVEEWLGQGNLNAALNVNNSIQDTSAIESNHKIFGGTFISTLAAGTDSLTQNQLDDITYIANQCPELGGGAVLRARAFLNWYFHANLDYSDSCASNARINEWVPLVEENVSAIIYPNPNNGTMTLSYTLPENTEGIFEILDLTGRVVSTHYLRPVENEKLISEEGFSEGVYFYRIRSGKVSLTSGKLVIVK